MKQIKKYFTMKWCALISALLGMLGYAACGSKGEESYGPDLYGEPYAKFKVEGAVFNEEGVAVEGVKVYVRDNYGDTAKTDQNGKFVFEASRIWAGREFWVMAKDPSGVYATDSICVATDFKGGDGDWYAGSYSTTQDFTLKKKPAEPSEPENSEETETPQESETPSEPETPETPSNPEE